MKKLPIIFLVLLLAASLMAANGTPKPKPTKEPPPTEPVETLPPPPIETQPPEITEPPEVTEPPSTEPPGTEPPEITEPPGESTEPVETPERGATPEPNKGQPEAKEIRLPAGGYGPQIPWLMVVCAVALVVLLIGALVIAWARKPLRGLDPKEWDE